MIRSALVAALLLLSSAVLPAAGQRYLSPTDLVADPDGRTLYVAQSAGLTVVDLATDRLVREMVLSEPASGLALRGDSLFVTGAAADGFVHEVDAHSGKVRRSLRAGHMPSAPVLAKDGRALFVLNRFENLLRILDLESGELAGMVPLPREPIAAALTPDGSLLVVAHHLPVGPADRGTIAAEVSFIDTRQRQLIARAALPNGSTSVRGICLSPDGRYAFLTHVLARYHNPVTQLVRGWVNTNALSIVDVERRSLHATVLLDDVDLGAASPFGVTCSKDGKRLGITLSGTHEVCLIDLPALFQKLSSLDQKGRAAVRNQFSFLVGMRRRIALPGNGPRAARFVGPDLVVAEYFTDSLAVVGQTGSVRAINLGPRTPPDPVRLGEILFNDADLCFQKWQSCASCHPDVRTDALNWDLMNDGLGNPKNTKSLLLAHETPPSMITGVRENAELAVRAGITHVLSSVRPEEDARTLDLFLRSVKPVPSPYLVDGKLSHAAERGQIVFEKAQCAACHKGPYFTDLKLHDLGHCVERDQSVPLDTPSLIEVWRTAPYLHDGRAPDLRSLLVDHNAKEWHGKTSGLSEREISDLVEYLRSL